MAPAAAPTPPAAHQARRPSLERAPAPTPPAAAAHHAAAPAAAPAPAALPPTLAPANAAAKESLPMSAARGMVRRLSFGRDKKESSHEHRPKEAGLARSLSFGSKPSRRASAGISAAPVPPVRASSPPTSPRSAGGAEPEQDGMSDLELSHYLEHLERNHAREMAAFNREQK